MEMKKLILKYYSYDIMQYKWGRKWIGGKFYLMRTALPMADMWVDEIFTSCQAFVVRTESLNLTKLSTKQ